VEKETLRLEQLRRDLEARVAEHARQADALAKGEVILGRRRHQASLEYGALERKRAEPPRPAGDLDAALAARIPQAPGTWTIDRLEQLIRRHGNDFPDRYDEWQSYVFYLREFADASGRLPQKFNALLNEVFEPIAH
jgi:hypothetical protein